jgi:SAM-dependent methyltransferase
MKHLIKKYVNRISEDIASRANQKNEQSTTFARNISFRTASEIILNYSNFRSKPNEVFYGISDEFWFWLHTEGVRINEKLGKYLPGVPDEYTQEIFTGNKGDTTLAEAFNYYKIFKQNFEKYKGEFSNAHNILDFGCGWGRIIRYFIKDIDPSRIWGCDPVSDMVDLCKQQNAWCNFQHIATTPPTSFEDNTFDLIYSYSVFSHLSEDFHLLLLPEIKRILRPGGIYMTTTRNRQFIMDCAEMRKREDLDAMNPGPRSSSQAFLDTQKSLSEYDNGLFTHHNFNDVLWPYWGETAIPRQYVENTWKKDFKILDFLELDMQNVIIVQKAY